MIQNRAMLVDLTIRQWTATKHDRRVSAEIEHTHAAHDAGRYNKRLIDKTYFAEISRIANELRKYHYARTHAWTDKGQRLLPSDLFMDYRQDVAKHKADFQAAVQDFVRIYPTLVQEARKRLNTMFVPTDYPDTGELWSLFGIEMEFMPVPDAQDFRVDVAEETQNEIRLQISESLNARQASMVKECWSRMREVVGRIADQCGKENGVIRESLITNASDLVAILGALNVTNDPDITAAEAAIREKLVVPVGTLRASPTTRAEVAASARTLLNCMPGE